MVGERNQNVFLNSDKLFSRFAQFEISEFEISIFDFIMRHQERRQNEEKQVCK